MANVLTDLAADIYVAADIVAREQVGAVSSVVINGNASERVAVGGVVRSHFTRAAPLIENATASMTIPEGTDQTVDNKTATISKTANVQIPWTGEDIRSVNNGSGFETIYGDQIAQAMRAITNKIEQNLLLDIYVNASRVVGASGTTPFASNFDVMAEMRQILADNGTPTSDGQIFTILSSVAGTKLRNLAQLQKANEAGSDRMLRQGVLLDLQGIALKETAFAPSHTKGTGTGYAVNAGSGLAVGTTAIPVDTGANTIVAGDVITFAADTANQYVVATALAGGVVTIAAPGLRVAIPNDNAITVTNSYTANATFHRNAVELIIRPPAMPMGGDAAVDMLTIQDPRSGLVFEIAAYKGYQKAMFDVRCVYGYKVWKPEFVTGVKG
jgi:hypothetical protein